jgi:membrane protein implicated in regulation of membrane protease activity
MSWWGWIIVGALLFGAELFGIDAAFYLIFVGISALVVGIVEFLGFDLPIWGELLLFAGLSLTSMVLFRERIYKKLRAGAVGVDITPKGDTIQLAADLAPGDSDRVEYRGTTWKVTNSGGAMLSSGSRVEIRAVDGATLIVS